LFAQRVTSAPAFAVGDAVNVAQRIEQAHGIVAPTGPPGAVVIFDCNTMHGSNSNITPFPRANAFLVYNAVSNALVEPFCAKAPRPDFIASRAFKPLGDSPGLMPERAA